MFARRSVDLGCNDGGAEALDSTADLNAGFHVFFIQLADHEALAWDDGNIAILTQALKRFSHWGSGNADLGRKFCFRV